MSPCCSGSGICFLGLAFKEPVTMISEGSQQMGEMEMPVPQRHPFLCSPLPAEGGGRGAVAPHTGPHCPRRQRGWGFPVPMLQLEE